MSLKLQYINTVVFVHLESKVGSNNNEYLHNACILGIFTLHWHRRHRAQDWNFLVSITLTCLTKPQSDKHSWGRWETWPFFLVNVGCELLTFQGSHPCPIQFPSKARRCLWTGPPSPRILLPALVSASTWWVTVFLAVICSVGSFSSQWLASIPFHWNEICFDTESIQGEHFSSHFYIDLQLYKVRWWSLFAPSDRTFPSSYSCPSNMWASLFFLFSHLPNFGCRLIVQLPLQTLHL